VGHIRLGTLPDTAPWRRVIGLIANGADVAAVAEATTAAAAAGLDRASRDPGVSFPFFLLTRVVLAARDSDFAAALRDAGIAVGEAPEVIDVTSAFGEAADRRLRVLGRTDLGEMARLAASEALTVLLSRKASNLFEITPAEVRRAAYRLSTRAGFATLAHDFYARFARRFLTYHLGRELGLHVGGNGVFDDTKAHDQFVDRLSVHCREAAEITHRYAGEWYSKQNFQGGITEPKTRKFVGHCLQKLRTELQSRGARDG
jgi:hypothetical protein